MKLITFQVLKIKNNNYGYLPMLKWLRHYQQELSLSDAIDWIKSLPQTLGPYTAIEAKKIKESLSSIAEIYEETVTQKDDSQPKTGSHQNRSNDLLEAEEWLKTLSQNDKDKINLLLMNYINDDIRQLLQEIEDADS